MIVSAREKILDHDAYNSASGSLVDEIEALESRSEHARVPVAA